MVMHLLRRIFGKKKTAEEEVSELVKEKVSLRDVEQWLETKKQKIFQKLNYELAEEFSKMQNSKEQIIGCLKMLQNAKLHNETIPQRERDIMEGNRETYIKKIMWFSAKTKIPEEISYATAEQFLTEFDKNIDELSKATVKPFQVLQFFYANEAKRIAAEINSIIEINGRIKKIVADETRIKSLRAALAKADELKTLKEFTEESTSHLEDRKQLLEKAEKAKNDLDKEIEQIRNSEEYKQLGQLTDDFEELSNKKTRLKEELNDSFYLLQKPLRKYQRDSMDEDLIEEYLVNPIDALFNDKEYRILDVLKKTADLVKADKLEVKPRMKTKTLDAIQKINNEYLARVAKDYSEIEEQLKVTSIKQQSSQAGNRLNHLKYQLAGMEAAIKDIKREIDSYSAKIGRVDLGKKKQELQELLREITRIDVELSL